jgi:multicomponent Na+:H+ antiporter subunit D
LKAFFLPALVYYIGILILPFIKGKARKPFLIAIPTLALINTILIRPQTSWVFNLFSFELVFMKADKLSLIVGYIFAIIGLLGVIFSLEESNSRHIFAYLYIGSSLGAVFAGDFLSLYVFWEIMAVAPTFLVWLKRDEETVQAGYRYLAMHAVGGLIFLVGILYQFRSTGSLAITPIHGGVQYLFILIGVGLNAAFVPIHTWLPDTYPRGHFTDSIFLCVYTTKTAVYMLHRTFPSELVVGYIGAVMALYGVSYAIMQSRARKLLSYHVISQVGYMVASVGLGTGVGLNGSIGHLVNHIFYKALLFMCIGSVVYMTGKEDLLDMGGLSKKMPITTICCIIAALSISGVPGFNGYISKSMMLAAAHNNQLILLMLEMAAVGTFLSFCKVIYFGFLRPNPDIEAKDPPLHMNVAMIGTAFFCVSIGVIPPMLTTFLPYEMAPQHFYALGHTFGTILLLGTALLVFKYFIKYYSPHRRLVADFDFFYRRLVRVFLWICRNPVSRFGDMVDRLVYDTALLKPVGGFLWFCKNPASAFGDFVDRIVTKPMVDFWLPLANVRAFIKWFEAKFIPRIVYEKEQWQNQAVRNYLRNAEVYKIADAEGVDAVVNSVADGALELGAMARKTQTGFIQVYATTIVVSIIVMTSIRYYDSCQYHCHDRSDTLLCWLIYDVKRFNLLRENNAGIY